MDSRAMKDYIKSFSLDTCAHGSQGYSRVLLQLFGYFGHGKSSFINSCKYVMDDGPYTSHAEVVGLNDDRLEYGIRNAYDLTDTITLVDNRGCPRMTKDEIGTIYAQLANFLPLGITVKWQTGFKDMLDILLNAEQQEPSMDFIVPVFIYSAKRKIFPEEVTELKEIMQKTKDITGLVPTVVITHNLSEHLSDTQEKFRSMGLENMFPIENYAEEDQLKTQGKDEDILKCLYEIIRDVEFKMRKKRDPIKEKMERKRILYEFAHQREIEKVQERENSERSRREEVGRLWREERENRERAMMEERQRHRVEERLGSLWLNMRIAQRERPMREQIDKMDEVESLLRNMMEKWRSLEEKFPLK